MKKILSLLSVVALSTLATAQVLYSTDFNSFTTGNLGTQGGWGRDNGSASQAKIAEVSAATHGKSLQFARTNAADMWIYRDITNAWIARDNGKDLLKVSFDFHTGTGTGYTAPQLYADGEDFFNMGTIGYDNATKDFIFYDDSEYVIDLFSGVTANTWYHFDIYYNFETGDIKVMSNGNTYEYVGTLGKDINEIDFYSGGATLMNSVDNIVITALPTDYLATSTTAAKSAIKVYPNPTADYITISSDKKISSVAVFDAAGKVAMQSTESKVNLSSLAAGTYIVKVTYSDGKFDAKKVIRK